jgi:anti-anti-sigma regulatory factor
MTLKIERSARRGFTVFALSGRIEPEHVAKIKELFKVQGDPRSIVVDLKDVKLVDREAVRFLARSEADGVKLENCPAYICEWMEREKD